MNSVEILLPITMFSFMAVMALFAWEIHRTFKKIRTRINEAKHNEKIEEIKAFFKEISDEEFAELLRDIGFEVKKNDQPRIVYEHRGE